MGDERGTRLNSVLWSLTGVSGVLLSLRIYTKIWSRKGLWWDDHFLIISWVSSAAHLQVCALFD
jgi:hypothetical protein